MNVALLLCLLLLVLSTTSLHIHQLHHVTLVTQQEAKLLNFYKKLGFTLHHDQKQERYHLSVDGVFDIHIEPVPQDVELPSRKEQRLSLAFLVTQDMNSILAQLNHHKIGVVRGPVLRKKQGLMSVFVRDPDGNLIELSNKIDLRDEL